MGLSGSAATEGKWQGRQEDSATQGALFRASLMLVGSINPRSNPRRQILLLSLAGRRGS